MCWAGPTGEDNMNDDTSPGAIPEHPILQRLRAQGISKAFLGYVAPSTTEGYVALYPSLFDLTRSIEIPVDDIVHVEEAPKEILPFGGTALWVRQDSAIASRLVSGTTASSRFLPPQEAGRLRMTRRSRIRSVARAEDWDPNCTSCHSPCQTCHEPCSVCVSTCQVTLPQ